jgi:hypothetical protein
MTTKIAKQKKKSKKLNPLSKISKRLGSRKQKIKRLLRVKAISEVSNMAEMNRCQKMQMVPDIPCWMKKPKNVSYCQEEDNKEMEKALKKSRESILKKWIKSLDLRELWIKMNNNNMRIAYRRDECNFWNHIFLNFKIKELTDKFYFWVPVSLRSKVKMEMVEDRWVKDDESELKKCMSLVPKVFAVEPKLLPSLKSIRILVKEGLYKFSEEGKSEMEFEITFKSFSQFQHITKGDFLENRNYWMVNNDFILCSKGMRCSVYIKPLIQLNAKHWWFLVYRVQTKKKHCSGNLVIMKDLLVDILEIEGKNKLVIRKGEGVTGQIKKVAIMEAPESLLHLSKKRKLSVLDLLEMHIIFERRGGKKSKMSKKNRFEVSIPEGCSFDWF